MSLSWYIPFVRMALNVTLYLCIQLSVFLRAFLMTANPELWLRRNMFVYLCFHCFVYPCINIKFSFYSIVKVLAEGIPIIRKLEMKWCFSGVSLVLDYFTVRYCCKYLDLLIVYMSYILLDPFMAAFLLLWKIKFILHHLQCVL